VSTMVWLRCCSFPWNGSGVRAYWCVPTSHTHWHLGCTLGLLYTRKLVFVLISVLRRLWTGEKRSNCPIQNTYYVLFHSDNFSRRPWPRQGNRVHITVNINCENVQEADATHVDIVQYFIIWYAITVFRSITATVDDASFMTHKHQKRSRK
jgi:hypothetical protein